MVKVSVVICTFNREKYIKRALQNFTLQTSSSDTFEVLIINNNSTDSTSRICQEFVTKHSNIQFKYIIEKKQGHTFARNRGISEAKGDIIAFLDDDAFVNSNYIKNLIYRFETDDEISALGGKIVPVYEQGYPPKWMSKFLLPLVAALDMGENTVTFKGNKFPIGANMAFRKSVFKEFGFFDEKLGRRGTSGLEGGDEKDIFHRLKREKRKIIYDPNIKVDHIIPDKRLKKEYIKGLGLGVGTSEKKRLRGQGFKIHLSKVFSEMIKSAGTVVLFFYYSFLLKFQAAFMLVKFRYWVIKGLVM